MKASAEGVISGGWPWTLDVADGRPEVRRLRPKRTMPSAGDSNWIGGDCSKRRRRRRH